ncbi:P-loop containing nucleoside triphosphate hydrolase protein [Lipomyces starkeyi]
MLCGEDGSIDITDFLDEAIKGPGSFSCDSARGSCEFSEPAMDDLIQSVFGDETITLTCNSGECLHYSELPGYEIPKKSVNKKVLVAGIIGMVIFIVLVSLGLLYLVRKMQDVANGAGLPSEDESYKLMTSHTPATLLFDDVTYTVGSKKVLHGVQGVVRPGEIMAVMGASGAGKTSLLDILAHKNKGGVISGDILVNGFKVSESQFKSITGFVDQDEALMPTLTVYETILNSALLRLPKTMSRNAKRLRVLETMNELGIMGIKDQVIGWEGPGGEKRRVAIACELVTSPSILFLDEPTSGLDSFNAYNVVECLQSLARDYKRTVIFTIHQPRSNIVALFDRLILLSHGQLVYSGLHDNCQEYFASIGYECPSGFNLADFLIDLTMKASKTLHTSNGSSRASVENEEVDLNSTAETANGEGELIRLETRSSDDNSTIAQGNGNYTQESTHEEPESDLDDFVIKYKESTISDLMKTEIQESAEIASAHSDHLPAFLYGGQKIGIPEQFVILSGRTFKNLYRDPMLLLTHSIMALVLAVLCGYLYYDISNDISGFQNRLGLFFFLLALFGFSTLTSLHVFASERQIFVRERANGFYVPISYFASKVAFDIIPLRVFPPVMLGLIIYPLVGLNFENHGMVKFLLVLTLFNLAAAAICLCIGVMVKDTGVASLIGSLVMLFSLLFAGLFLNRDSIPKSALWIQYLSIFHYAFEAMAVNEVRYLTLIEYKYGLSIEVPGATILSTFGFNTTAYRSDVTGLVAFFGEDSMTFDRVSD